jgi:hypothetical protein
MKGKLNKLMPAPATTTIIAGNAQNAEPPAASPGKAKLAR